MKRLRDLLWNIIRSFNNRLGPLTVKRYNYATAGTYTITNLGIPGIYLAVVVRLNTSQDGQSGLYILQVHNTCSIRTIANSSVATLTLTNSNNGQLQVVTSSNYVHLILFSLY